MARNFYWEMVFSSTLSENRPVIKKPVSVEMFKNKKTVR